MAGADSCWLWRSKIEIVHIFLAVVFIPPHFYSSVYEFYISGPELKSGNRCKEDCMLEMGESNSSQLWRNKNESITFLCQFSSLFLQTFTSHDTKNPVIALVEGM
jgi:hypothetical protein